MKPGHRRILVLLAIIVAALVTMGGGTLFSEAPSKAVPIDKAPAALQPAVERAQHGMQALQQALQAKLVDTMSSEGPVAAVRVCGRDAYVLSAMTAEQQGIAIGRTSHGVRNPRNAPRPWAAEVVASGQGRRYEQAHGWVVDLGDRVGVLQPVEARETCIICHGAPAQMPLEVSAALKQAYPEDRGTGFTPGDLRGWLWAEVPK
jgi:hypothetical protein